MICPSCQVPSEPRDKFCMNCGILLDRDEDTPAIPAETPVAEKPLDNGEPTVVAEEVFITTGQLEQHPVLNCPSCHLSAELFDSNWCTKCGAIARHEVRDDFFIKIENDLAARSHVGVRHHRNEDFVVIGCVDIGSVRRALWFVVADGVSQSKNPQQASQRACEAACDILIKAASRAESGSEALLRNAIDAAQEAVSKVAPESDAPARYGPPATTIVAAYVIDGMAYLGWCGDSRIYAISPSAVDGEEFCTRLLTRDHSCLNEVIDEGYTLEEAIQVCEEAGELHTMLQCLGELTAEEELFPSFAKVDLKDSVCIFACSDGVWNDAHPMDQEEAPEFGRLFHTCQGDALKFAEALVANASGADNNTCAVAII